MMKTHAHRPRIVAVAEAVVVAATVTLGWGVECAFGQGGLPFTIEPPKGASDMWSSSVASGGDVDGDGREDVFVMDPGWERDGVRYGRWHLYSGRTGALAWTGEGTEAMDTGFAYFVAAFVADMNGDGLKEILLGRPYLNEIRGAVDLLSGGNGRVLASFRGENPDQYMGRDVANVGDVTSDGIDDFAYVKAFGEDGLVSVRSGADGSRYATIPCLWPRRIRGAGDFEGDGFDEMAVGSWSVTAPDMGVRVYSGRTGETLLEFLPEPGDLDLGYAFAAGRDVTGDGVPDLALVNYLYYPIIRIVSGAGGGVVTRIDLGPEGGRLFGQFLEFTDLNGDGHQELLIGGDALTIAYDPLTGERLHRVLSGEGAGTQFITGNECATGDINGDGAIDLVIGFNNEGTTCYGGGTMLLDFEWGFGLFHDQARRGGRLHLEVRGSSPGRRIQLLGSRAGNSCTFVSRLGICIDLNQPIQRVAEAIVGLDGIAPFEVTVPADALLGLAWIQAVDPDHYWLGPITSNVMRFEVVE